MKRHQEHNGVDRRLESVTGPEVDSKPIPPSVPEWLIANIAEAIKNTQQVFFLMLSILAYCAVTVVGSSDRQIALNSTVQLPILNSNVSFVGFMVLAPSVALLVYIYLHLYVLRLKSLVLYAEASFAPLESRRLYPWVLAVVEPPEPGSVGALQDLLTHLCLWWVLPIVLLLFSLLSIKKHSVPLTMVVGSYQFIAVALTIYFWRHFYSTANERRRFVLAARAISTALILCNSIILFYLAPRASSGSFVTTNSSASPLQALMILNQSLRKITTVDLSYQVLITEQKNEYDTYWVDLEGARLEGSNLKHAILKLANLRNAHLQGANCDSTTFRTAMMEGADFQDAELRGADLSYAKLQGARNLLVGQACKARTLYGAKMDTSFAQAISTSCPYVLSEKSQDW
jgi:hypothetical protein